MARLWNLTSYGLHQDEIFSLRASHKDWGGLFDQVLRDVVHPPLFYMVLKVWISIGNESTLWLHLFPTLTAIATLVPFFLLSRELHLRAAEMNLALLLMAVNGFLIYYSLELRMYSLLLFSSLFSLWLFVRFFNSDSKSKQPLLALFVLNLLLVYTHYFGWLVVAGEFIFLLFLGRRKLLPFAISVGVLVLCFSPWVYLVARQKREDRSGLVRLTPGT